MSLKNSIPYFNSKLERNCKVYQEQFTKRSYDSSLIETEIEKIEILDSKKIVNTKSNTESPSFITGSDMTADFSIILIKSNAWNNSL